MNIELKKAILRWICDNNNEWQLTNACADKYRPYIYDAEGNFLIGGEEVHDFIVKATSLFN